MAGKKSKEAERKRQLAYDMYIQGRPMREIMEKTGYKKASIKIFLNMMGVNRRVTMIGRKEECIALYEKGMSYREIAKELSVSPTTVRNNLKKWGYGHNAISIAGCEREPELEPGTKQITYAEDRRKVETIVADGKRYQDITSYFM